jgi:hypothetical protein
MNKQFDLKTFLRGTNKKGLADFYEITPRTMRSWLKPHLPFIGDMKGGCYTPKQMGLILKRLGPPPKLVLEEDLGNFTNEAA